MTGLGYICVLITYKSHSNNLKSVPFIFMIFILLLYTRRVNSCEELFKNHIGKTTADFVVAEGDPLEINCTLIVNSTVINDETVFVSSEMLYFKHGGSRIPNSRITLVDEKTAQYYVKKASIKDSGKYICYIDLGQRDPKFKLICPTFVNIANPPRDIPKDNFNCIGEQFRRIVCSWKLPDYRITTDSTLHLLIGGNISYSECPERINKTSCAFSTRHKPPYRIGEETLRFALESKNVLGTNWQIIEIDHFAHVIPGPPQRLKSENVSSNSVSLVWSHPKRVEDDSYLQEMMIFSVNFTSDVDPSIVFQTHETHIKVQGLTPFTNYSVQVRSAIKSAYERGLQSEPAMVSFLTNATVPYSSPVIPQGGFLNLKKMDGIREVILYYSPIKKKFRNGPDFTYTLSIQPSSVKEVIRDPDTFSIRLRGLSSEIDYKVEMISSNSIGLSTNMSVVEIPAFKQDLPSVKDVFAVDEGDGSYVIGWITSDAKADEPIVFYVYSCIAQVPDLTCTSELLPAGSSIDSSISVRLSRNNSYNFAVAPLVNNRSLGLTWASCIEKINYDFKRDRFKKFEVISLSAHSIVVYWDLDCRALYSFIKYFEVGYCKIDNTACSKTEKMSKAIPGTNELIINHLDSNSLYSFKIFAYTMQNQVLESIRKTGQTKVDKLVAMGVGLLIVLLILCFLVLVYAFFSRLRRKRKEQSELQSEVKSCLPNVSFKLTSDPEILLNTLCQGRNTMPNTYENKEYMNAPEHNYQTDYIDSKTLENMKSNGSDDSSTSEQNQRCGLIDKQDSQSNSNQNLFNSTDSGYETKNNSDLYGKPGSYILSSTVDTGSEEHPYACIDDASSFASSESETSRNEDFLSKNYVAPSDSYIIM